jgi:hypothetical protein
VLLPFKERASLLVPLEEKSTTALSKMKSATCPIISHVFDYYGRGRGPFVAGPGTSVEAGQDEVPRAVIVHRMEQRLVVRL